MKKDLESKQQCIESLETRNIQLNQIRNDKDEEINQQCKIIKSINNEIEKIKKNNKEKEQLDKKKMYEAGNAIHRSRYNKKTI